MAEQAPYPYPTPEEISAYVSSDVLLRILMQRGVLGTFEVHHELSEELFHRAGDGAAGADDLAHRELARALGHFLLSSRTTDAAVRRSWKVVEGERKRRFSASLALLKRDRPEWI